MKTSVSWYRSVSWSWLMAEEKTWTASEISYYTLLVYWSRHKNRGSYVLSSTTWQIDIDNIHSTVHTALAVNIKVIFDMPHMELGSPGVKQTQIKRHLRNIFLWTWCIVMLIMFTEANALPKKHLHCCATQGNSCKTASDTGLGSRTGNEIWYQ